MFFFIFMYMQKTKPHNKKHVTQPSSYTYNITKLNYSWPQNHLWIVKYENSQLV